MCDPGEACAALGRSRASSMPGRAGRRRRGGGVLAVVAAAQQRLGGQRVVGRELDARRDPRPRGHDCRAAPARRSAASRRGRPRSCPWRSRWSGSRLSSTATSQLKRLDVLELEARELADHPLGLAAPTRAASRCSRRPRPRRPARGRSRRAARVVVDLPFVPVTPTKRVPGGRAGSSRARAPTRRGSPARAPRATSGASPGTPGRLDEQLDAVEQLELVLVAERCGRRAPTSSPRASSRSAAAAARAREPVDERLHSVRERRTDLRVVLVEEREAGGAEDAGDDPEAHHDLRLRPGLHLEVVVQRGHQEDAPAPPAERDHLEHHRERLDHEDPTDEQQQELDLEEDRHRADRARRAPSRPCRP